MKDSLKSIFWPSTPNYDALPPKQQMIAWYTSRILFVVIFLLIGMTIIVSMGPERAIPYLVPIALALVFLGYRRLMDGIAIVVAQLFGGIPKNRVMP